MKTVVTSIFLIVAALLQVDAAATDGSEPDRNKNDLVYVVRRLVPDLNQAMQTRQLSDPGKQAINLRYGDDLLAILVYWERNDFGAVELAWWRATHRDARLLILALFATKYGLSHDVSIAPDFMSYSSRFSVNELAARKEEIAKVNEQFDGVKLDISKMLIVIKEHFKAARINNKNQGTDAISPPGNRRSDPRQPPEGPPQSQAPRPVAPNPIRGRKPRVAELGGMAAGRVSRVGGGCCLPGQWFESSAIHLASRRALSNAGFLDQDGQTGGNGRHAAIISANRCATTQPTAAAKPPYPKYRVPEG